jgi:hypothetical protein
MKVWFCALAAIGVCCSATPARAAFHLWKIQEIFSNQDGTVQFIELFTTASTEFFLSNHQITATSDGVLRTFTLNHDLGGAPSTSNRTFLIATASFGGLAGAVTPDYPTLPAGFFNPNAGSITLNFSGVDSLTFAGATLPKDGVNSLVDASPGGAPNLGSAINSPKNFAQAQGSINLTPTPVAGDFDGDGDVNAADLDLWRGGYGLTAGAEPLDGDADGDFDVDGDDFVIWQRTLTGEPALPAASMVPEPSSALFWCASLLGMPAAARLWPRRRLDARSAHGRAA